MASGQGAGARENTAGQGGRGGGSGPAGPAPVATARTRSPFPGRLATQRTHYPHTRKAHFSSVGRTWPPAGSRFPQVTLLFHPALPSSRLPQEGPALPRHRVAPARESHWSPYSQRTARASDWGWGVRTEEGEGGGRLGRPREGREGPRSHGGLGPGATQKLPDPSASPQAWFAT